jgi:hypothetical protein
VLEVVAVDGTLEDVFGGGLYSVSCRYGWQ